MQCSGACYISQSITNQGFQHRVELRSLQLTLLELLHGLGRRHHEEEDHHAQAQEQPQLEEQPEAPAPHAPAATASVVVHIGLGWGWGISLCSPPRGFLISPFRCSYFWADLPWKQCETMLRSGVLSARNWPQRDAAFKGGIRAGKTADCGHS